MPIVNWEFSVWNVSVYLLSAIVLAWRAFIVIDRRVAVFESVLSTHAATLSQHAARMDAHDGRLITVIEQIQRLIGRTERGEWDAATQGERRRASKGSRVG